MFKRSSHVLDNCPWMLEFIPNGGYPIAFKVQTPKLAPKSLYDMALPIILSSFSSCLPYSFRIFLNATATLNYLQFLESVFHTAFAPQNVYDS